MGATLGSEATAAAENQEAIRRDPMAMLPFCGYNMGDYWKHWLSMQDKVKHLPVIFRVNWFRKAKDGSWLWPGFGQNMRVLQWVVNRVNGKVDARETVYGYVPNYDDINWNGLAYDQATFEELMAIDPAKSVREVRDQTTLFDKIGDHLPAEFKAIQQEMLEQLQGKS
jgi:phosphoenolpyruvate carboxykinase (GTP)